MRRRLHERVHGDEGLGLILVIAMGAILTGLMILSTTTAIRSLGSSREHVNFESALAVADGGVDLLLARSQQAYVGSGSDTYFTPSVGGTCSAPTVQWTFTTEPTADQERAWARAQLLTLANTAGCLTTTRNGQYVLLKPKGRQSVYVLGWSPKRGAKEAKQRLIKAEYLFTPYAPAHAILTAGPLLINSSTTVTTAPPNDPTLAAVHTNGALTVENGNPTVYGKVTQAASGGTASSNKFYANPGGGVIGAPVQPVRFPGALAIWNQKHADTNVAGGWYDLCPDGTARRPDGIDPVTGLGAPCAASATVLGAGSFRGWTFDGTGSVPVWSGTSAIKQNGYSGTYYIHKGNVLNPASNSGSPVPNLTVLASAVNGTSCNKVGGNITWGSTDPAAPSLAATWLVADQDLLTTSNYQAGSASGGTVISGTFTAGDQISMSTSSNGAYGAVVAADQCDPANGASLVDSNEIKNPSIYYDPNAQAPYTDVINNTLWLEYPG